ncbi:MAG: Mercuric reductase [Syntrophaceae bacterium PtaB.Bin095]|jgi:pyruvate/2-oxoglutarate dehydrogenase complex dihydrolipoamide dehydrogenase (E3) component/anti-anti-sigma regulatory factor|nr:MAG: Mercuric reductase [Syntrophaceae bacterium PtaB.Bin095]
MLVNTSSDYDLIVIGAGIAGMVAAVTANGLGKRVAVIEKNRVGGNCTNATCIPSKTLIRLSHLSHGIARLHRSGLLADHAGKLQGRKIMPYIRGIVQQAYEKDIPETFSRIGIRIISGSASFVDSRRVEAAGQILSARKFIIAAGTSPLVPTVPGMEEIGFLTNETLYSLEDLPESVIILGGGVDGLEYASAFVRLGVETTVIEAAERFVPSADIELVNHLLRSLRGEGVRLLRGARPVDFRNEAGRAVLRYRQNDGPCAEISANRVLIAVGRKPDLEGLGLEKAGVACNSRGVITDRKLRTSAPNIYACGDIAGPYQLATTAEVQGIIAATNAFLPVKRTVDYRHNVYVVFAEPPLAWVGLTEEEAYARYGRGLGVYRFRYDSMRRALIDGNGVGMAKILCGGNGRIVGAHILGEGAGEVIHELQVIMASNKPLYRFQELTHAYPTYAQAIVGRASQLAFLDRMGGNTFVDLALRLLPGFANRLYLARDRLAESHRIDLFAGFREDEASTASGLKPPALPPSTDSRGEGTGCTVEAREAGRDAAVLDVRGNLTDAAEQAFAGAFGKAMTAAKEIRMNLSGLAHMDADGAGLLLVNAARAIQRQVVVSAFGLSIPLWDAFRLTGLDRIIALFGDEGDAQQRRLSPEKSGLPAGPANGAHPPLPGWSGSAAYLRVRDVPARVMNINADGRRTSGPVQGFGRLWEKRYRMRLHDADLQPRQIVSLWRSEFPQFWPAGNRLYTDGNAPVAPGASALLNLALPGGPVLATGLMVIYADDTSFAFMTAEGHILSGWITFRCFHIDGATFLEIHPLFRAADPLMELGLRLGGGGQEDRFWRETLGNLARRLGTCGDFAQRDILVDPRIQWHRLANLRHNSVIRSFLHMPLYMLKKSIPAKRCWNRQGRP